MGIVRFLGVICHHPSCHFTYKDAISPQIVSTFRLRDVLVRLTEVPFRQIALKTVWLAMQYEWYVFLY